MEVASMLRRARAVTPTLSLPRVELPSPDELIPWLRNLVPSARACVVAFALVAFGGLAYFGARETSVFAVSRIDVVDASPRLSRAVRGALAGTVGESLLALNRRDIERRLAAVAGVAAARYDRDFPHTLRIYVVPEHSIAVARQGANAWIVASDGRVVRAASATEAPRLPRVWVAAGARVRVGAAIADAPAARAIRAVAAARAARFGRRILLARSEGGRLTLVLADGFELRLGGLDDLRLKVAIALRILPRLRRLQPPPRYLDVSVPERPVAGTNPRVSS
jgi:cell division septal protein FtsQ